MKKKQITNLIILDASGSMGNLASELKGGLKLMFKDIKKEIADSPKNVKVNTIVVDFSSHGDFNELVNDTDGTLLTDNISDSYTTRGMTALTDAIGRSISQIPKSRKNVFVSIFTDGEENDSKEFTKEKVGELIDEKIKNGWKITFIGATGIAANQAASFFGTSGAVGASGTSGVSGMSGTMKAMNKMRSSYYTNTLSGTIDSLTVADYLEEEDKIFSNTK